MGYDSLRKKFYNERDAAIAFLLTVAMYLIVSTAVSFTMSVFLEYMQGANEGKPVEMPVAWSFLLHFISQLTIFISFFMITRLTRTDTFKGAGLDKGFNPWLVPGCAVIIIFMLMTVFPLTVAWDNILKLLKADISIFEMDMAAYTSTPLNFLITILCLCLLPAIGEELVFRGVFLRGIASSGEKAKALLLSALAFSLMHMSPVQTIYQFGLGLIFGYIVLRTGSLYPAIILHFFNNLAAVLINYFNVQVPIINNLAIIYIGGIPLAILGIIFCTVFIDLISGSLEKNVFVRFVSRMKYRSVNSYYDSNLWFDDQGAVPERERYNFEFPRYREGIDNRQIYFATQNRYISERINRNKRWARYMFLCAIGICVAVWVISLVTSIIMGVSG